MSETKKIRAIFASIIILVIVAGLVDFGQYYNKYAGGALPNVKEMPFHLGLDLLGGTHLVYKADVSEVPATDQASAVEGVRDVIERRVNVFGVSEPNIQTAKSGNEHRIIVELAGVKDVNEAIKMIGETPLLEFKEENNEVKELTPAQQAEMDEFNEEARAKANSALKRALANEDFNSLINELGEDKKTENGQLGWINSTSGYDNIFTKAEKMQIGGIYSELVASDDGFSIIKLDDSRVQKEDGSIAIDKKEVKASHILICYQGSENCESDLSKDEAKQKIDKIKEQATTYNFSSLAKEHSTGPSASQGGDLGWFNRSAMVDEFSNVVFDMPVSQISEPVETKFGWHLIYKTDEKTLSEYKISRIFIKKKTKEDIVGPEDAWKNTELTGRELQRSTVQFNPNDNTPEIKLEFNAEGKDYFAEITERNVGRPVAIFLDNIPISIPTVNEPIKSGDAVITGKFTIKEAKLLAQRLNAGALPVPIELINQQTVGASLGQDSVEKSLKAGIIGLILIAIFMVLAYRLPGVLAVISLVIYGLIVIAIFKLWPVTLTLSGVAGFILSVGMAVDANVLIFSRFKEELRDGKPATKAIDNAFLRAWPSIRDGNISTLLTCFVLINFTTSIVKGFAITLGIGVMVSMFSAIVITKVLMQMIIKEKLGEKKWLF